MEYPRSASLLIVKIAFNEFPPKEKKLVANVIRDRNELPNTLDTVSNKHLAISFWFSLILDKSIFDSLSISKTAE